MENKISLVYENGEFTVYINDEVVTVNKYPPNNCCILPPWIMQ